LKLEDNLTFVDTFAKIKSVMEKHSGQEIRLSYSGGSDSDAVAWILKYLGYNVKCVIFDTGLEYNATWRHVDYMRSQGHDIEIMKVKKPIPWTIKKYGVPYLSKNISDKLQRLQHNSFQFKEHGSLCFDDAYAKYPHSKSALRWWTDNNNSKRNNISWNRGLKDFLIINDGLPFNASPKCCYYAKKQPSVQYSKENNIDLMMLGIRIAEGGNRATGYSSCYIPEATIYPYALYMPIFWWKNADKEMFDEITKIKHSDCYSEYGMLRTGCPGCPFGQQFEEEIESISKYEPQLEKAVGSLFGESYEWIRKYKEYQRKTKTYTRS